MASAKKLKRAALAFSPNRSLKSDVAPVCYGYARIGADRHAGHGLGLDSQDAEIEDYYGRVVEPRGVPFKQTLVSPVTANNVPFANREHGARLREKLSPGDHLVIARIDRAFRDVLDCVDAVRGLAELGVVVHIVELDLDASDEWRLMRGGVELLRRARYAKEQASTLSDRTLEKNAVRRMKGWYCGGAVPLGFKLAGPKGRKHLTPDEEEREVMRRLADWAAQGLTSYAIEQHLVKNRVMRRVPDTRQPRGYRLEFWSRQAIGRAVRQIREIDGLQPGRLAGIAVAGEQSPEGLKVKMQME